MKYEYTSEDLEFRKKSFNKKSKAESNCFLQFIEKLKKNKKWIIIAIISGILLLILIIVLIAVLVNINSDTPIKKN